ncbi:MAG TPA: aldehyde dehydrogenase family protein [Abditibacteriaceae bacterium]|nr:aldehyde dehydrogenase family protein [Abditibacteriaceae bacterium]
MTQHTIPALSYEWPSSSLIWGVRGGSGDAVRQYSPLDHLLIQQVRLLDECEMEFLLRPGPALPLMNPDELWSFAERLHTTLQNLFDPLLETMQLETAFIRADCEEVLQGTLNFIRDFQQSVVSIRRCLVAPVRYELEGQARQIRMAASPWGTVAVILPQSAFLIMGVTSLLNALAAGNRVILRAPLGAARSAALFTVALEAAGPPQDMVSVVQVQSREFVKALHESRFPSLMHYMGSSRYASEVHAEAFQHGNAALIDGEGNSWVWVGEDADVEATASLLTHGAIRYNGQTCTSINGALIHPKLYPALRARLHERWCLLKAGNPLTGDVQVGPLLDATQGKWCERRVRESGGDILCGGSCDGNLFMPTLVDNPSPKSELVTHGLYGCALWIASADRETFVAWWRRNQYPLCAGVLSPAADSAWWLAHLPNLARLVINSDPSIEHIFEPWGGYPGSSVNPVGTWKEKYQRIVAVDEPVPGAKI